MKKLRFLLQELVSMAKKDIAVISIILISVFISMLATLILLSTMCSELESVFTDNFMKVSYSLELEGKEDLETFMDLDYLPRISSVQSICTSFGVK